MHDALQNLLLTTFGLRPRESLTFIHDEAFRPVLAPLRSLADEIGIRLITTEIRHDGIDSLSAGVKSILLGQEHPVILFGLVHNIWHTPERKTAKYDLGKRLASLVAAPEDLGGGASLVNSQDLSVLTRAIAPAFTRGARFAVSSPAGSNFTAIIGTQFCEDGKYDLPGTGGDFPSGEVGFGPQLESVNGTLVYDLKVQHIGIMQSPLRCHVERDRVVKCSGPDSEAFSQVCDKRGDVLRFISEISLGMNPAGVLTHAPQFIPEEKNYGTLHCGHGGNASYGTRRGPHLDGVMGRPTVHIDGKPLMIDGRLVPGCVDKISADWLEGYL